MDSVREAWTDERLDDLTRRVDSGFDRVDADLREIRSQMSAMQRTMIVGFVAVLASTTSVLASIVATQL
jgi:hypothetical protein